MRGAVRGRILLVMTNEPLQERLVELERLREKLEAKRENLDRLLGELVNDIVAVRRVLQRNLLSADGYANIEEGRSGHGEIREAVEEAIGVAPEVFDVNFVRTRLSEIKPRQEFDASTLSGCLRRFVEDGLLEVVVAGAGRRATTYRRKAAL